MPALDVQLQTQPPKALPTTLWNGKVLWQAANDLPPLDLSLQAFPVALKGIYEDVGFCELIDIIDWAQSETIEIDKEALFATYNFRYDNKLEKTLTMFRTLPHAFRVWARKHGMSPADLYPLCALSDASILNSALLKIAGLQLSRSQGAQLLELLTECALLKTEPATLIKNSSTAADWVKSLQSVRYPETQSRDYDRQKKLMIGWPKTFVTRWLRQGDHSGVEVRFFVSSKKDLAEKISSLSRVLDGLSDD